MTRLARGFTISTRASGASERSLTRVLAPACGVPGLEATVRRVEVRRDLALERRDLLPQLEELVRRPALLLAHVVVALLDGDRLAAFGAGQEPGWGREGNIADGSP